MRIKGGRWWLASGALAWWLAIGTASALDLSEEGQTRESRPPKSQGGGGGGAKSGGGGGGISAACKNSLSGKKIAIVFEELQPGGGRSARQSRYAGSFPSVAQALRNVGLTVYSQEEIQSQIAQAETESFLNNDMDASINAAKRLGAAFILRGSISSRTTVNRMVNVNQVAVDINFALSESSGKMMGEAGASGASYAGADVIPIMREIIGEQIGGVVRRMYASYCSSQKL